MDMNALMTAQGMREWTETERDENINAATQLRQMAQIIKARLENTHVDGDRAGGGHARKRARAVVRHLHRAARDLDKAAARIEAMNAVYVREVLELPARRVRELGRKELRRQRLGIAAGGAQEAVAKSLAQSATALAHGAAPVGNPQVKPVQQPQYVNPQPYVFPGGGVPQQPLPDIGSFFDQEAM